MKISLFCKTPSTLKASESNSLISAPVTRATEEAKFEVVNTALTTNFKLVAIKSLLS